MRLRLLLAAALGLVLAWLAYRGFAQLLAGYRPAWLAHAYIIVVIGIGYALLLQFGLERATRWPGSSLLVLILLTGLMVLLGSGIDQALRLSRRAAIFADGEPYCLLSFDREGKARPALSTLEISPLVMRVDGRYPVAREAWLMRQGRYGIASYRYVYGRRSFEPQRLSPSARPCTPK